MTNTACEEYVDLNEVNGHRLIETVRAICTGERLSNAAEAESFAVMKRLYEDIGCKTWMEYLPGYVSTPEAAFFPSTVRKFPSLRMQ